MSGDVNGAWEALKTILEALENSIPLKMYSDNRRKAPWLTHSALKLLQQKYRIHAKYKSKDHPAV
jgi:hypothetical protein